MSHSTMTKQDLAAQSSTVLPGVTPQFPTRRQSAIWQWLKRSAPTAVVVVVLAGLAVWGHSTEWTLPKYSALVGHQAGEEEDWCKEHNVPESQCIECNPKLHPPLKDYGWCEEHGVAQCPLHHPDVAQLKTVPVISAADMDRARLALAIMPRPENNSRCKLHQRRIQFTSVQAMEKVGVDVTVVLKRPVIEAIVANAEVGYAETHSARLASRVAGTVVSVQRKVGDQVRKDDVLALIDAADVGKAKAEFLQAISQLQLKQLVVERLKPLAEKGAVAGRQYQEAETAFQEAQIRVLSARQSLINLGFSMAAEEYAGHSIQEIAERIQFLGLSAEMIAKLNKNSTTSNLFPMRAPLDGVVVDRKVVPGEIVDPNRTLFNVADVRRMWLTLNVRQDESKYVALDQKVLFRRSDGKDEPEIPGTVSWISTSVDEKTRMVQVRVDLKNPDGRLRAHTFGTGRIVLREEPGAVVVPSEAVHWDGCCHVVFVRDKDFLREGSPKFFHIRKVRPGVKSVDTTEIIVGLLTGEVIASKNSVVLEAQLLKSNLGAGCGCADGH